MRVGEGKEVRRMENNIFNDLNDLAIPIQKFIEKNYNPHCAVVITVDNAKVISVELSTPLPKCE